jgi:hypothetical protein
MYFVKYLRLDRFCVSYLTLVLPDMWVFGLEARTATWVKAKKRAILCKSVS